MEGQRFVKYTIGDVGRPISAGWALDAHRGARAKSLMRVPFPDIEQGAVPTQGSCPMQLEQREWQEDIDSIMADFEKEHGRQPLYTICFY